MKYGIFGASEQTAPVTSGELTIEELVMADEAYAEALDLAHEAEVDAIAMAQAEVVAEHLEEQAVLGTEAAQHPEMINSFAVALAHESMVLATAALGGSVSEEYSVTTESMTSAPVQAMEVTTEGFTRTVKNIYEGIKMFFKRIALSLKKIVVKLVVVMNGSGKKAEKMLKNFRADKNKRMIETKLEGKASESTAKLDLIKKFLKDNNLDAAKLSANMEAVIDFSDGTTTDLAKLKESAEKETATEDGAKDGESEGVLAATVNVIKKAGKVMSGALTRAAVALNIVTLDGGNAYTGNAFDDEVPSDAVAGRTSIYPVFYKGTTVTAVCFYGTELDEEDADSPMARLNSYKYKVIKLNLAKEAGLPERVDVWSTSDIETRLGNLKTAGKKIKSMGDKRISSINKLLKAIDKHVSGRTGFTFINRYISSEFSRIRMLVANLYISSALAEVSNVRHELSVVAKHISMYESA